MLRRFGGNEGEQTHSVFGSLPQVVAVRPQTLQRYMLNTTPVELVASLDALTQLT